MATAALYNALPSLEEADAKFVNREHIFAKLAPVLAKYDRKFGVCLIHRHCDLEEGEMMVATGNISQPERNVTCYPDRWLPTGEAFEFSRNQAPSPPQELFEEFRGIVQGLGVLGLFNVQDEELSGGTGVERTEGRRNITEIDPHGGSDDNIPTGWILGLDGNTVRIRSCSQCKVSGGSHFRMRRRKWPPWGDVWPPDVWPPHVDGP